MADEGPAEKVRVSLEGGGAGHGVELVSLADARGDTSLGGGRSVDTVTQAGFQERVHGGSAALHDVDIDESVLGRHRTLGSKYVASAACLPRSKELPRHVVDAASKACSQSRCLARF